MPRTNTTAMPTLNTIDEAAQKLNIPLQAMRKLAYGRKIPTIKFNRRVYVTDEAITQFVQQHERPAMRNTSGSW